MSVEQAILKVSTEMTSNKDNPMFQIVGEFLLQHLDENPQDAERLLSADKTIGKSLTEMRKAAEKNKVGNCAVLTDQEGFAVVLKHFEIDTKPSTSVIKPVENVTENPKSVTNSASFDINLDDLL